MKLRIFLILAVLAWALPTSAFAAGPERGQMRQENRDAIKAHREQQKSENKDFRQSIKDLPPDQKISATVDHRNTQYQENVDFRTKLHTDNVAKLQERLNANTKLTADQKQEILNDAEQRFQENKSYADQEHQENMEFLQNLAGQNLTPEELKAKLKEHREAEKAEHQQHRQTRKEERKSMREQFHAQVQDQNSNPTNP